MSPMSKTKTVACALCEGTGWRPVERNGVRAVEPCPCQAQARNPDWWMERARIPARFQACDFDHFMTLGNHSLELAKLMAQKFTQEYPLVDKGILFLGNPGVGKTHLTVAIMRELMIQKQVPCLFTSFPDLLERLQESYDPVAQHSKAEILDPVLDTEVVAIDDLGARRISDWVEDTVTYILNHRYNNKKITLLTSNLSESPEEPAAKGFAAKARVPDTLSQRIGMRVYSRLFEMCQRITLQADDFRQVVQQHNRRFL